VAGIGAGTDARVAVFDHRKDITGIPHAIARIVGSFRVIVKTDHNIVFLDQFFDRINGIHGFGRDGAQPHRFGELEQFSGLGFVLRDADDAVVHRPDFMLGQLFFDLLDYFGRGIVIPAYFGFILAQLLARIKLDDFAAGLGSQFDGFENGETIEGISLATDEKAAGFAFIRDFLLAPNG